MSSLRNYNTVEMTLTGCAVLVNLAGIMFESNRFQSEYFQAQRDAVTIITMGIIILSIVYYVVVVASEVYITIWPDKPLTVRASSRTGGCCCWWWWWCCLCLDAGGFNSITSCLPYTLTH